MKRLSLILTSILLGLSLQAQTNPVTAFTGTLKGKCATFSYTYSMTGQMPLTGSGEIRFQNDSFIMKGDDLEIYCDGTTRWTIDTAAEECYIESISAGEIDIEANPAMIVGNVAKAFKFESSSPATFKGRKVTGAVLSPKSQGGNIQGVTLYLSGNKPEGALIKLRDGSKLEITISGFTLHPQESAAVFRFNTAKLNNNYILTDLR